MKKFLFALFTLVAAATASANVETFDSAAAAAADGFQVSNNVYFHDAGRPYLEYWDQTHSITAANPFTFNSLDFNYDPWAGYNGGNNTNLNITFLDASNNVLLNTIVSIPTSRDWITYSNSIANVSKISFAATNGFWPSFDNLVYNASNNGGSVPEPTSIALFALGLLGLTMLRRRA